MPSGRRRGLIRWAEKVGPATGQLVSRILESRPHPEQGYRACLGIMRLGRQYGNDRLDAASARAMALGSCAIAPSGTSSPPARIVCPSSRRPRRTRRRRTPTSAAPPTTPRPPPGRTDAEPTDARQAQRHEAGRDGRRFQKQLQTAEAAALSFEERLGLLVDTEWTAREQRKLQRRLHAAKLRHPATLEAVDFTHPRRLNRQQVLTLGACAWIAERHNLILIGPSGIGKSFLCCAFVERACRRGFTARYVRMPRLLHELAVGRGDGSYARL